MNDILNTPIRKSFRKILADEKRFVARQEKIAEEQNRVGFFDAAQAALEKENSLYWFLGGLNKDEVIERFKISAEEFDDKLELNEFFCKVCNDEMDTAFARLVKVGDKTCANCLKNSIYDL